MLCCPLQSEEEWDTPVDEDCVCVWDTKKRESDQIIDHFIVSVQTKSRPHLRFTPGKDTASAHKQEVHCHNKTTHRKWTSEYNYHTGGETTEEASGEKTWDDFRASERRASSKMWQQWHECVFHTGSVSHSEWTPVTGETSSCDSKRLYAISAKYLENWANETKGQGFNDLSWNRETRSSNTPTLNLL